MELWTVYNRPADFPESVVARQWLVDGADFRAAQTVIVAPTLEKLRALLPEGLCRLARDEEDDPVIVETWL